MLLGRDKHRCLLAILELLGHGRLWVNRAISTVCRTLPVCPDQLTSTNLPWVVRLVPTSDYSGLFPKVGLQCSL
jgi:hypothetical protein